MLEDGGLSSKQMLIVGENSKPSFTKKYKKIISRFPDTSVTAQSRATGQSPPGNHVQDAGESADNSSIPDAAQNSNKNFAEADPSQSASQTAPTEGSQGLVRNADQERREQAPALQERNQGAVAEQEQGTEYDPELDAEIPTGYTELQSLQRAALRLLDTDGATAEKLEDLRQGKITQEKFDAWQEKRQQELISAVRKANPAVFHGNVDSLSIDEDFYKRLANWDGETTGFSFVVGETSEALQDAGIPKKQIRWDASKIKKLLKKHPGMKSIIAQVPELLEHPIVVIDSKSNEMAKIVMGDLRDSNKKTVTVVLLLEPTSKKGNKLDLIKISSAEGRGHIGSLFKKEDGTPVTVRYVDKKRIHDWLNANRLQLPLHNLGLDSNNSILPAEQKSNRENLEGVNENGRSDLPDGSRQRNDGESAGEQAGSLDEGTGRTEGREQTQQGRTAAERRDRAESLPKVSARTLGVQKGTERENLAMLPDEWVEQDEELRKTADEVEKKTGRRPRFFVGEMELQAGKKVKYAKGARLADGTILIRADHDTSTAEQIGIHEAFHENKARGLLSVPTLRKKVLERFTEEEFSNVVNKYIDAYKGVIDIPEDVDSPQHQEAMMRIYEEIFADADAGVNAFGANATMFSEVVQEYVAEQEGKTQTAAATERTTGPPSDAMAVDGEENASKRIKTEFEKTVDDVLSGADRSKRFVLMGYTPKLFRKMGMPSLPVVIGTGHIYSIAKTKAEAYAENRYNSKTNYHGLGDVAVKELLSALQNPVLILAAKDVDKNATPLRSTHSVVVIIDIGQQGTQRLIPVEIAVERTVNGAQADVNVLSTSYDRSASSLLQEAVAQEFSGEKSIYYAKKEATDLLPDGVQFPRRVVNAIASNGIVRNFDEKVNMGVQNQTQSLQFKRWFGDWQKKLIPPGGGHASAYQRRTGKPCSAWPKATKAGL